MKEKTSPGNHLSSAVNLRLLPVLLLIPLLALTACGSKSSKVNTAENAKLVAGSELAVFLTSDADKNHIDGIPHEPWIAVKNGDDGGWEVVGSSLADKTDKGALTPELLSEVRTFIRCETWVNNATYKSTSGYTTTGTSEGVLLHYYDVPSGGYYGWNQIESKELPKSAGSTPHYIIDNSKIIKNIESRMAAGVGIYDDPKDFTVENGVLTKYENTQGWDRRDYFEPICIPENVTAIGDFVFARCGFSAFIMGPQVTSIGRGAFSDSDQMTSIDLSHVQTIGPVAFEKCNSLETVTLSDSENYAEDLHNIFMECPNLREIIIPDSHPSLMTRNGIVYSRDGKTLRYIPEGSDVPWEEAIKGTDTLGYCAVRNMDAGIGEELVLDSFKDLGHGNFDSQPTVRFLTIAGDELTELDTVFEHCPLLETVTITAPIREIGSLNFYKCPLLREVILPETLEVIEGNTFEESPLLAEIRIPASVTEIDKYAFPADTVLIVTKGSYAEEYAKENNRSFRYEGE